MESVLRDARELLSAFDAPCPIIGSRRGPPPVPGFDADRIAAKLNIEQVFFERIHGFFDAGRCESALWAPMWDLCVVQGLVDSRATLSHHQNALTGRPINPRPYPGAPGGCRTRGAVCNSPIFSPSPAPQTWPRARIEDLNRKQESGA